MGENKALPYVVITAHRDTAIFLLRGRKFVHLIERAPHFRVHRVSIDRFDSEYRPLSQYSNGAPSTVPYDVQSAARRYLEYSRTVGITETALRCLTNIIEGKYDMSVVESAPSDKNDSIVVPKMEKLDTALKQAASKNSTKNGTTTSAKRPSKAQSVGTDLEPAKPSSTSKEQEDMKASTQSRTSKTSKTAGAVVMKAKPGRKAPAAKKAPVAKKAAAKSTNGHQGRAPTVSDDAVLTHVVENPKRKGTDAFRKFAVYKVGMRIGDVIKKNVNRADVNYNLAKGFIKVKKGA